MGRWAIGPITGQYQPEDLSESQEAQFEDQENIAGKVVLTFKTWSPREVQVSFVVDGIGNSKVDPEVVWATILELMRPRNSFHPREVPITLPGWGGAGRNVPSKAVITNASIQRTHIRARTEEDLRRSPVPSSSLEQPRGGPALSKEQYDRIGLAAGLSSAQINEALGLSVAPPTSSGSQPEFIVPGGDSPLYAVRATITLTLKEVSLLLPH